MADKPSASEPPGRRWHGLVFRRRRKIDAPPLTLYDDGHQPGTHSPGVRLAVDVV